MLFFKQKTAYEMRISDWSSDVCSSDLLVRLGDDVVVGDDVAGRVDDEAGAQRLRAARRRVGALAVEEIAEELLERRAGRELRNLGEIGRASCRERGWK